MVVLQSGVFWLSPRPLFSILTTTKPASLNAFTILPYGCSFVRPSIELQVYPGINRIAGFLSFPAGLFIMTVSLPSLKGALS